MKWPASLLRAVDSATEARQREVALINECVSDNREGPTMLSIVYSRASGPREIALTYYGLFACGC